VKLVEQRFRLLQIAGVEPLSEPRVNWIQQLPRLLHLALVAPEAGETYGGSESPRLGSLLAGDREGALEIRFGFRHIRLRRQQRDFSRYSIDLGFVPSFLGCLDGRHRFANAPPGAVEMTDVRIGPRQIR
jgi:hypothetical protein